MKCLRLILILVISVAIPVNGFAAAPVSPCPMQAPDYMVDNDHAAAEFADMMMDCCEDMHKQPQGKCKTGQSCSLGGVYFALPVAFQFYPPVSRIILATYASPHFSEPPNSIWHPPQSA